MNALQILIQRANGSPTPLPVASDIETIARHIACVGFAWSPLDAICIPIMLHGAHYFPLDEEIEIILKMREVLTHPNIKIIGQNWSYDTQHFVRHWGFRPRCDFDTMLAQHVCFPGIPKDLGFLASMYCSHFVYWKDELTDYHKMPEDIEKFWLYNAKDCVNTWEIHQVLGNVIHSLNLQPQFDFLMRLNRHVITMMIRGVRIDRKVKDALGLELLTVMCEREEAIEYMLGRPINIGSPKQMQELFYEEMGFKPVLHKKTKQPTTDDNAIQTLAVREPLLRPVVDLISETRSIGVFLSTFVQMPLDKDLRMRSSFNVGGTETFRFSSSKDAFGSGGNLQNIPKGDEDKAHDPHAFVLPNIRKLFIPDPGMTLFDVDLAGADAQVVAWEAEDDDLKAKFRSGQKIHALNAKDIYGADAGPDGKREPYYKKAKMGCHLSNYGGKPATLSKALGMTIHESELFQRRWFSAHPGILEWHRRTENDLMTTRSVRNKFGFRRFYFERMENLLPQALAWIPQSTVALVINNALCKISETSTDLELLLQVHDSLVGQFPTPQLQTLIPILYRCLQVTIPYDDPLTIGTSLDLSTKSWGDLEARKWTEFPGVVI
jgi:DNA polymerase-1